MKTVHLTISGRVQGVYFRAFTQKQAIKHQVTGFVRNKPDGSVEVIARATPCQLEAFISCCHKGPILASVKDVLVNKSISAETFTHFEIR